MATNPAVPFWDKAETITASAGTAVTGKRFVTITGARTDGKATVGHAAGTATTRALGVSAYDADAGNDVTVYKGKQVMPVTAAVAITAGQLLYSAADGRATNVATGNVVAIAVDDAAAGDDVPASLV